MHEEQTHKTVREAYGRVANEKTGCCGAPREQEAGEALSLGCGDPTTLAGLREGEVVVDLGSGAGFDAIVSAPALGPTGRFIGVDMTQEMLERARRNAVEAGIAGTVEFREGLIENLPVTSESADVVISNCVVNLSPDKPQVFREAFRVLKPGGRLAVSDIVLTEPLPEDVTSLPSTWVACIAGALTEEEYLGAIREAGFVDIRFERVNAAALLGDVNDPLIAEARNALGPERVEQIVGSVYSYSIRAIRPSHGSCC